MSDAKLKELPRFKSATREAYKKAAAKYYQENREVILLRSGARYRERREELLAKSAAARLEKKEAAEAEGKPPPCRSVEGLRRLYDAFIASESPEEKDALMVQISRVSSYLRCKERDAQAKAKAEAEAPARVEKRGRPRRFFPDPEFLAIAAKIEERCRLEKRGRPRKQTTADDSNKENIPPKTA